MYRIYTRTWTEYDNLKEHLHNSGYQIKTNPLSCIIDIDVDGEEATRLSLILGVKIRSKEYIKSHESQ